MPGPGRVLVTGASGFVGGGIVRRLSRDGWNVRASTRRPGDAHGSAVDNVVVPDAGPNADWSDALRGVDAVVHCAARVHVMKDTTADPLAEFRRVNTAGTLNLASQAEKSGARRFLFVSSIAVNGAETFNTPFRADDEPNPDSPYGVSKHEAERGLRAMAECSKLEIVIVRPPLVFGPNAPGNFNSLLRAVAKGIPMPFGAIYNRRSFVALENLVDLLKVCLEHPSAVGQVFLVSDGEDLSTTDLFRRTAAAMGRPNRLIPVPANVVRTLLRLLTRSQLAQSLCGSLQVDINKTREVLGWTPKVSIDVALRQAAHEYLRKPRRA